MGDSTTTDQGPAGAGPAAGAEPGPLQGVCVLDLASVGPAARCTRLLADYGADVIKIGPVPASGATQIEPAYFAYSGHRGMRRVLIDLKAPAGRQAFLALAEGADVVIESFRPGVVDRLGIGYHDVKAVNAAIVYCSTTGYGQSGPRAAWAGHDIDYLGIGGFLATTGPRADGGPPIPGATVADAAAGGMHAALAICAALLRVRSGGPGTFLDVSVADGVLWLMSLALDEHLAAGAEPGPGHDLLTGRYACYDAYCAGDGKWLAVGAIEPKFWANLCRLLSCDRWLDHQLDDAVQDDIRSDFAAAFAAADRDHWVELLCGADTCVAPVLSVADAAHDDHFAARGAIVEADHPVHGRFRQLGPVLAGMPAVSEPVAVPDFSRSAGAQLFVAAGVDESTVAAWLEQGAVA